MPKFEILNKRNEVVETVESPNIRQAQSLVDAHFRADRANAPYFCRDAK